MEGKNKACLRYWAKAITGRPHIHWILFREIKVTNGDYSLLALRVDWLLF